MVFTLPLLTKLYCKICVKVLEPSFEDQAYVDQLMILVDHASFLPGGSSTFSALRNHITDVHL